MVSAPAAGHTIHTHNQPGSSSTSQQENHSGNNPKVPRSAIMANRRCTHPHHHTIPVQVTQLHWQPQGTRSKWDPTTHTTQAMRIALAPIQWMKTHVWPPSSRPRKTPAHTEEPHPAGTVAPQTTTTIMRNNLDQAMQQVLRRVHCQNEKKSAAKAASSVS